MTFTVSRQHAQRVNEMARVRDGLPYAYGGAFTHNPAVSTDCSGLVLQTGAWFSGRSDWPGNRYGSTESFRLDYKIVYDLGFKRLPREGLSALPFTPVMLVGLQHGGGGRFSHTACTLMTMDYPGGPVKEAKRGVDWESQGGGVFLYEGARAWNDPLFHDFWYLDAKLEDAAVAPSGGDAVSVLVAATGISEFRAREVMPTLREGLRLSQCTTVERIAVWLAQVGHESAGFQYTEEIAKNGRYAPYIGRTWIQITWESNYRQFSKWCFDRRLVDSPDYFVDNYERLRDSRWAGIGPAWYWTVARPDINSLCDRGEFDTVTLRINGGQNGAADRRRRYELALAQGDRLLDLVAGDDAEPSKDSSFIEGGAGIMANVPQEQWDAVYRQITQKFPSRSPLRHIGEGLVDNGFGMVLNTDANMHVMMVKSMAELGDKSALKLLAEVAGVDVGAHPDRRDDAVLAQRILADIEATRPSVLDSFLKGM